MAVGVKRVTAFRAFFLPLGRIEIVVSAQLDVSIAFWALVAVGAGRAELTRFRVSPGRVASRLARLALVAVPVDSSFWLLRYIRVCYGILRYI